MNYRALFPELAAIGEVLLILAAAVLCVLALQSLL